MIRAPSEIRCMSMPNTSMSANTIASVRGIASATTKPGRMPRLMKLIARMIATACHNDSMNSPMACSTVTGWLATRCGSMPSGRSAVMRCSALPILSPSASTSPPSRMAMPRPIAGLPSTRNMGCGGSAKPRRTCAMSLMRIMRPLATKLMFRMSCSDSKAPVTRSEMRSSPVSMMPAGRTWFCACSAASSAERSMPRLASSCIENSTKITSSCAPMISTFETSGTFRSSERMLSTWSRSSRWVKPSAVKP